MEKLKLQFPLKTMYLNQGFAQNANEFYAQAGLKGHEGVDLSAYDGQPIYASHDGRVSGVSYEGARGLGVRLRTKETHPYDTVKQEFISTDESLKRDPANIIQAYAETIYWHMKTGTIKVTAGQEVKRGDFLGGADNTGRSTGTHLHYGLSPQVRPELWAFQTVNPNNGYGGYINPMPYFEPMKEFKTKIKLGDRGSEVAKIQALLIRNGYMPPQKVPLGYYGNITRQAVFNFQLKECNLNTYEKTVLRGMIVGDKTLEALNRIHEQ